MAYPIPLPARGDQTIHPADSMSPCHKSLFWDMCAADVRVCACAVDERCACVLAVETNECACFCSIVC